MSQTSRQSENAAVKRTLESTYCPEPIRQARERQDELLAERLGSGRYAIADIGCGNGYHAVKFAPVCRLYHGFEISPEIAQTARDLWKRERIDHAEIFVGDVAQAELQDGFYDVAQCLYFTAGNLREPSDDLSLYDDAYLDRNPGFIRIVSRFAKATKRAGSMFLTVYQDVPDAQAAQYDYYHQTGQHVVTPPGSRFVATAEGFWSARWTEASMRSNLAECGIDTAAVQFHELNPIAWLVEISL